MVLIPTANSQSINPYWKLALVFKCLSDNIILDNFQSVLQQLKDLKVQDAATPLQNGSGMRPNEIYFGSRPGTEDGTPSLSFGQGGPSHDSSKENVSQSADSDRGTQSRAPNAVGRLGLKIYRLPHII